MININDLPDDVFDNIASYADHTKLDFKCELAPKLESDLRDTVDWGPTGHCRLGQEVGC